MRKHRKYAAFHFRRDSGRVRSIVRADNVAFVRLEPVLQGGRGALFADVGFACDDGMTIVPFVEISGAMLDERECSPFIWPSWIAQYVGHGTAADIERAILPWLESQTFNRTVTNERIEIFNAAAAADFHEARRCGFTGAAPYGVLFRLCAPYVYAARHAQNRRVSAHDAQGGSGAAMLSSIASFVRADLLDDARNELARKWFDLDVFGAIGNGEADVSIGGDRPAAVHIDLAAAARIRVPVAAPVPMDVPVSFDPEDAPPVRWFGVSLRRPPTAHPALPHYGTVGGSSGRVLILLRDDAQRAPDADTDNAELLAERLRAEGFTVDVTAAPAASHIESYDLVHCMCASHPEQALPAVRRTNDLRVPVVLTTPQKKRDGEATWGTSIVPMILRTAHDEIALEDHLRLLAARKVEAPGASLQQEPYEGYRAAYEELDRLAQARVPEVDAAFLPSFSAPLDADGVTNEFILVHAPITPRANQLAVVLAAGRIGLSVVLAGPVVDVEYATYVRAFAPAGTVFLPEPAEGQRAALYARARVFADVPWLPFGSARRALAQAVGTPVATADPADVGAVSQAVLAAWHEPRQARVPDRDPLARIIAAYSICAPAGRNT